MSSKSKGSVFHYAKSLLADLVNDRSLSRNENTALVFVAYSLGGIVVKDALSLLRSDLTELSRILEVTIGVIFLGTPYRGSKAASLGNTFAKVARIVFGYPEHSLLTLSEVECPPDPDPAKPRLNRVRVKSDSNRSEPSSFYP